MCTQDVSSQAQRFIQVTPMARCLVRPRAFLPVFNVTTLLHRWGGDKRKPARLTVEATDLNLVEQQ